VPSRRLKLPGQPEQLDNKPQFSKGHDAQNIDSNLELLKEFKYNLKDFDSTILGEATE
jgi:hypothetical protein